MEEDENVVDSVPQKRKQRARVEQYSYAGAAPAAAYVLGVPLTMILIALIGGSDWASKTVLAGLWPYLIGFFALLWVPCVATVAWHVYKLKKSHKQADEKHNNEVRLLREQVKLSSQTNQLVQESRLAGDNIEIQFNDNGGLKSVKIIRAAEQSRVQQAGRVVKQVTEHKPEQIVGATGSAAIAAPPVKQPNSVAIAAPSVKQPKRFTTPAPYDLIEVMRQFDLTEDNIFLGKGDRRVFTCDPRTELCHGAFNAVSGRGKTIMVKGIETQALKVGHRVIHLDIKYTLRDEKGNDYRPVARALWEQGYIDMGGGRSLPHLLLREDHIISMIEWLAGPELLRRLAMYARGDHSYGVMYVFLEELAYLVSLYKFLGPVIARLLVVGRSLGMKFFCVAQNFQVQNLKLNSGMRENFESAWFLGGDIHSGAALLDMTKHDLEAMIALNSVQLGSGVSIFRNNTIAYDADILRAGMASNDFTYWLMGKADGFMLPDEILPPIDGGLSLSGLVDRSEGQKRDTQRVTGGLVRTDFGAGSAVLSGLPQNGTNGLVETVPHVPTYPDFEPLKDDKLVPADMWIDLAFWYGKVKNVRTALEKIGLNNSRFTRHASYILESQGLKAKKL